MYLQFAISETRRKLRPKMRHAIASGIREAPVSYWPIFFLSPVTIPEVFSNLTWPSFFLVFKVVNEHLLPWSQGHQPLEHDYLEFLRG